MSRRCIAPAVALTLALAACGDDASSGSGHEERVALSVTVADGAGMKRRATLTCGSETANATGFLRQRASQHCESARALTDLLATAPDHGRPCTEIYGGPQTAHVRGTIGPHRIDRRLTRKNGCEIADWDRVAPLLAPSGIRPAVHT